MMALRDGEKYGPSQPLDLGIDTLNILHPHVSKDGNLLLFAMNDPNGFGGYDLYYSIKLNEEYGWSKPMNMGNRINTREMKFSHFIGR